MLSRRAPVSVSAMAASIRKLFGATARPAPQRQAGNQKHRQRFDRIGDIAGDGSLPLRAVQPVGDCAGRQDGRGVQAAAGGAGGGPLQHEDADGNDIVRAGRIGGKSKAQRPRGDDTRMRTQPARPAQQLPVPIQFVAILHLRRPQDAPRRRVGRHIHHAPVPGSAGVTAMSVRRPAADIVGQANVAIMAARLGGQVDGAPIAIDRARLGPAWIIAGVESPVAIEQCRRGAQRRRIGLATALEIEQQNCPHHQSR